MEIVLIRHGKPESAINPVLNAADYTQWIKRYNASMVAENSRPKSINAQYKSFYCVASDLNRAVHSAQIYLDKSPSITDKLYREMEIPRYKLPFKLKAWNWVYLSRILWLFGVKGPFESFKEARFRADKATDQLILLAEKHGNIVLFAHGVLNRFIRQSLAKKGWIVTAKDDGFWGVNQLKK
ncbi:histidine phosphatase family protein [Colwellia echini]|uniref:Histidine phosphatase family protein n=1 Tax=Colwellia echini TaxID=1982103 RepID=A0ABY3MZX7_9GAMM|nr:histidine phosphatase family protein [Colwellia echini]TYK66567.1 histidine phosphatase family protein [Colwellia echini]